MIDLDRFLVCHIFDPEKGRWRIAKRPGAELFLFYMAQIYEVVLFSSMSHFEGDPIVKSLDPFGCISYHLYRFATQYRDGKYVKDLSILNRDLKDVVIVGHDRDGFSKHSENGVFIDEWTGQAEDTKLIDLIDFLETLSFTKQSDVREVLSKYKDKDAAATFNERQQKAYEQMRRMQTESVPAKAVGSIYGLFGWKYTPLSDNPPYEEKRRQILELRIQEFEKAKEYMKEQLKIEVEKQKQREEQNKKTFFEAVTSSPQPAIG